MESDKSISVSIKFSENENKSISGRFICNEIASLSDKWDELF